MMPQQRRQSTRKPLEHLSYISLPPDNGGIVQNLSEGGLCFHAISPVKTDGPIHVRFAIDSPDRITAIGELAWIDETGTIGGLRFTELPEPVREQIRKWASQSREPVNARANTPPRASDRTIPAASTAATSSPSAGASVNSIVSPRTTASATAAAYAMAKAGAVDVEVVETARPAEAATASKSVVASSTAAQLAQSAVEANPAPSREPELLPVNWRSHPNLYNLRPPVYSAPYNDLSMFPTEKEYESRGTATAMAIGALRVIAKEHPVIAVGLTIGLAFLVSMGILALVAVSWSGD